MIKTFAKILCLILLCSSSLCSVGFGSCKVNPAPEVVQNFNVKEYMGKWYEQFRDVNVPFQKGECTTAEYSIRDDGKVNVINSEYISEADQRKVANGRAVCPTSEAKCKVSFGKESSFISKFTEGNYWVYETDYNNYSIIYSCSEFLGVYHFEFVWALTREAVPSKETLEKVKSALKKLNYPEEEIRRQTIQGKECVY